MTKRLATAALLALSLAVPAAAQAFDAASEARNFAAITERQRYLTLTPEFQEQLQEQNARDAVELPKLLARDPERDPLGNICVHRKNECAGDLRFYRWARQGFGIRRPVLYTARDGATISGNVWATRQGPPSRPAVVITTGSVQAPETLYWGLAATLAKHGYVVLTYDVQGQGRSDTFGAGADRMEGVPSQAGEPFYDGTEDGLDFLLSTPSHPYEPRPSCTTGTDHSGKQNRRVRAGLDAPYDPLWRLVDPERVGIAGHSLGASAVSYIGQEDPRVDAIVAWDNLAASDGSAAGFGSVPRCASDPSSRQPVPMTKPALGMSNDYSLVPVPYTSAPDPLGHNAGFAAYRAAGVDSMQVNLRGGTHYEYSLIPGNTLPYPLGTASLRGEDVAAWYTTAWFDRYVKCIGDAACEREAAARLLSDRWRDDPRTGDVDPAGDANAFSSYLRSQYDLHLPGGGEVACDDMRSGCPAMAPDGLAPGYSLVSDSFSPDGIQTRPEPCALPQQGTANAETPAELAPSGGGDAIRGAGGADRLAGDAGPDCLYGGAGRDLLSGDAGDDRLDGGSAADVLRGGSGNDTVLAADGARDLVSCGAGYDSVVADAGDRVASDCEKVTRAPVAGG